MKFQPDNCIYCGTDQTPCSDSVNTVLTITLDGEKISVKVCDAHAEEASVKTARECYSTKKKEFDEVLAKAASLGIKFEQPSTSKILVAEAVHQAVPVEPQRARAWPVEQADPTIMEGAGFVDLHKAESIATNPQITHQGNTAMVGGGMGRHNLSGVREQLSKAAGAPITGRVQHAVAAGRRGAPVIIPITTIDNTGTTQVRVANVATDHGLQERFKNMAQASQDDRGPGVHFATEGYSTDGGARECPLCHGTSETKDRGILIRCPKCQGTGCIV